MSTVQAYQHNGYNSWVFYDGTNFAEVSAAGFLVVGQVDATNGTPAYDGQLILQNWMNGNILFVEANRWIGFGSAGPVAYDDAYFQNNFVTE